MAPDLSVVIPIYNESPNLRQLYQELTETLVAWGRPYGIVAVDDGSSDDSFRLLAELHHAEGQRRYIESFSAYTRQFLEQLDKPQAERIDGIPPASR